LINAIKVKVDKHHGEVWAECARTEKRQLDTYEVNVVNWHKLNIRRDTIKS